SGASGLRHHTDRQGISPRATGTLAQRLADTDSLGEGMPGPRRRVRLSPYTATLAVLQLTHHVRGKGGDTQAILSWRDGVSAEVQLAHRLANTPDLPRPRNLGAELPGRHRRVRVRGGDGL